MTTKAQERKALEQIRQIVEALGPDSYIGIAMDGILDDAKENIENDFGISKKQELDCRRQEAEVFEETIRNLRKDAGEQKKNYEQLSKNHEQLKSDFESLRVEKFEAENRAGCAESKIVELNNEIIKLKAKLYDLMVTDQK